MSRFVVPFVTSCALIALSTAPVALADSTSPRMCADLPYVENVYWTTDYGPAGADVVLGKANMVPCTGAYALCFYSGPAPLTCTVNEEGTAAACECYPLETTGDEVYYVDVNGILNTCVYIETVRACGTDGSGCQATNSAPVCQYIQEGTFAPDAELISTFSTVKAGDYSGLGACTDCASAGRYAGCMTAPCKMGKDAEGKPVAVCECPVVAGPYQVGQDDVQCDAGAGLAWSASYNPAGCLPIPPGKP